MKTLEKQYIQEEYVNKRGFTAVVMIIATLAWLMCIFAIVFVVNSVGSYIMELLAK